MLAWVLAPSPGSLLYLHPTPWDFSHSDEQCCFFLFPVPKTQLTITGHGCADPVSTGTDAAVTVHLGLGSICVRLILQCTLCGTTNEGQQYRWEGGFATVYGPYPFPDKIFFSMTRCPIVKAM